MACSFPILDHVSSSVKTEQVEDDHHSPIKTISVSYPQLQLISTLFQSCSIKLNCIISRILTNP